MADTQGIPLGYGDYFELVDWSGRHIDPKKTGFITESVPKILTTLNIDTDDWLTTSKTFRRICEITPIIMGEVGVKALGNLPNKISLIYLSSWALIHELV